MGGVGTVAIVGAGPSGLVAARFLAAQGFEPTLFERHARVGGQWDNASASSGIWPEMRTNTSRIATRFSDLDYPVGTPVYPHNRQVCAYLQAYADHFDLRRRTRLSTSVTGVARSDGRYIVTAASEDGQTQSQAFDRVVIASGRYNDPIIPQVAGLETFTGTGGAIHAFHYKSPDAYRGLRVLIAGGNISSLEIASDLATLGAAKVLTAMRRQRYVVPKIIAGVPTESLAFTRHAALFEEHAPAEEIETATKAFVLAAGGNPTRFGAPAPAESVAAAGTTGSQYFLPLVAEGRIDPRPWITRIDGTHVTFQDGTSAEVDAIIFGTGFRLSLPYIDPEIAATLRLDDKAIDLADHTFHPKLENLAFLGLWCQIGPYWPALELQARYLAYAWGGAVPVMPATLLEEKVRQYAEARGGVLDEVQHRLCVRFARLAGVEPELGQHQDLARALLFGPLTAASFRLSGPDAMPGVAQTIQSEAHRYGIVDASDFTEAEQQQLKHLAKMPGAPNFAPLFAHTAITAGHAA